MRIDTKNDYYLILKIRYSDIIKLDFLDLFPLQMVLRVCLFLSITRVVRLSQLSTKYNTHLPYNSYTMSVKRTEIVLIVYMK